MIKQYMNIIFSSEFQNKKIKNEVNQVPIELL